MDRRESVTVGRASTRSHSASAPPLNEMVSVAVLPPILPTGMAAPSGVAAADCFGWDDALNWQHNKLISSEEMKQHKPSLRQKLGLTGERKRAHPESDRPPFRLRQVPFDVWRKHYAKDKDGNYRGTHAPAEDCLLKPHDVAKWRLSAPVTMADKWTRGKDVLPVYAEVQDEGRAPEYEVDYDGPPRDEPVVTQEEDDIASELERRDSEVLQGQQARARATPRHEATASSSQGTAPIESPHSSGLTDEQVRNYKGSFKDSWKQQLKRGFEMASLGS